MQLSHGVWRKIGKGEGWEGPWRGSFVRSMRRLVSLLAARMHLFVFLSGLAALAG